MMMLSFLIFLFCIFCISNVNGANSRERGVGEPIYKMPEIDLTSGGDYTLYVRLCDWSVTNSSNFLIVEMTRYCYCNSSSIDDPDDSSCLYPGPTLLFHENTVVNLILVNELSGNETVLHTNNYKDMDTTNIHTHGLHVSPEEDDILITVAPNGGEHTYNYHIGYHYPGTLWYHAHHHGSTTWQVNSGLHGALLMKQDNDPIDNYDQTVILFNWQYIIPTEQCLNISTGHGKLCPDNDNDGVADLRFDIPLAGYNLTEFKELVKLFYKLWLSSDNTSFHESYTQSEIQNASIFDNYAMCDVFCSFPYEQSKGSGYQYNVKTDSSFNPVQLGYGKVAVDLLQFFANGQLSPIITDLKVGIFHRLRLINSLSNWYIQFKFPSDIGECNSYLIATDGIYITGSNMNYDLNQTSHKNQIIVAPGGRADVLIRCNISGTYDILASEDTDLDESLTDFQRVYADRVLFQIQVNDNNSSYTDGTDQLPTQYPKKENGTYIADTTTGNPEPETQCLCNYDPSIPSINDTCKIEFSLGQAAQPGPAVNLKKFTIPPQKKYPYGSVNDSLTLIKYDSLYQYIINNDLDINLADPILVAHVYHQHINPFQVIEPVGKNGFIALQFTWWDTIGNIPASSDDYIKMNFWTRDYTGLIITHCHLLQHEDKGMMGYYNILENIDSDNCPNQVQVEDESKINIVNTTGVSYSTTKDDSKASYIFKKYQLYSFFMVVLIKIITIL